MKRTWLYFLLFAVFSLGQHGHAQQRERLVALCQYNGDTGAYTAYDSLTYIYSGTRSVDSSWGVLQAFDSSYCWLYNSPAGYRQYQLQVKTWNTASRPVTDTTWNWSGTDSAFIYYSYFTFFYTGAGLPLQYISYVHTAGGSWSNVQMGIKYYDSLSRQVDYIYYQWAASGTWDTTVTNTLEYDTIGQITRSATIWAQRQYGSLDDLYAYDAAGRLDTDTYRSLTRYSAGWQNGEQWIYYYDTLNELSATIIRSWKDSAWALRDSIAYTYDAHHNMIAYLEYSAADSGTWQNYEKYTATFDSLDMITTSQQLQWDSASWLPQRYDRMYHYYYEPYTLPAVPAGIAAIATAGQVRVYPVPASDILSVAVEWPEAQPATISVYDMDGRKYGEWHSTATASYRGYIPISAWPAGAYVIHIESPSGSLQRSFNISR